jgi:bifunctional DNA-binding transcriptional regulator/antitoxin component of YhaV-PrlF toxin-antitoxin module
MATKLSISPEGRLSLPVHIRERLGVAGGGTLIVEEVANGVLLRSVAQAIAQAQAINQRHAAGNPNASVDAFLANRATECGE